MTCGLCAEELRDRLRGVRCVPAIYTFDEIDSTNNEAKRMAASGFAGTALIAADRQSAGRGRMGRSFYSPAQTGAYFSLLYTPSAPLVNAVSITCATSVAVMRAIRTLTGKQSEIKWVNDLYWNGKKVCGILAEAVSCEGRPRIVIGIGVNIRTAEFPKEIAETAGALETQTVSPTALIAAIYRELEPYLLNPEDRSWLSDYRSYSCVIGHMVRWYRGAEAYVGYAEEIDEDGALLIRCENGRIDRLYSGEISVRVQNNLE